MARKKGLDTATLFGLILGVGSLGASMILEFNELNPDLGSAFLKISALSIIFGGTLGCVMTSFTMEEILNIPRLTGIALSSEELDPDSLTDRVIELAELARKEGVLALQPQCAELQDEIPFLASGFQYVIDGWSPESIKDVLSDELYAMEERHKVGAAVFASLGGYAPTMGIVGTVIGLIGALAKAGEGGSDPTAVVEAIATAFIATFYGIASANLIFLPIASKLQKKNEEEVFEKTVLTEAILAIQNGVNPHVLRDSLKVFFRKDKVKGS